MIIKNVTISLQKTKRQIEDEKDYDGRSLFDLIELEFSQGEENELLISR